MRGTTGPATWNLITGGSYNWRWVADVYYDGLRVFTDLPISGVKFSDDGTAKVQGSGQVTVTYSGLFADSIAPRLASDMLAPFGAELAVYVVVYAGDAITERIEMGWYRIVADPSIADTTSSFMGRRIVTGSTVQLTLQDRMQRTQRDEFDIPGTARNLKSVLAEVQRLSGLQITRELPDQAIPNSVAYQQSKLDAVYDLVDVLDAIPYMRPDGTLGQRPNVWPAQVDTIRAGAGGTLVESLPTMTNDKVYNRIAVLSAGGTDQTVLATAMITQGPLRAVNPDGSPSPYGQVTYRVSSPYVKTRAQAQKYATTWLPRVSGMQSGRRQVRELFNPLRQVGDVVGVLPLSTADQFVGRVLQIDRSDRNTQDLVLEVNA